ncbi:glycosyl hydrolase [Alkalicaulis satelles]|uniref:Endoglucanase n=2 Tax=Alkalicaulis satelles TaxID=2609175 RepID=A0A5M6ZL13_9PROT|nr:glycosyl hydrolase [Alkalicaulis satelles]
MLAGTGLAALMSAAALADAPAPLRLSQIGFEAGGHKRAILVSDAATPLSWQIVDASGAVLADGETMPFGADESSGQSVHQIDFSGALEAGEGYRLIVNAYESRSFAVTERPWQDLARDALNLFHQNRAGIAIEERHVERPDLARPAAHENEVLTCFSGEDTAGNHWAGCDHSLDVTGGWYDAGDHGKYVVNSGITVWTLLDAYTRFGAAYGDGTLPIAEAGNGVNDLLDEIRWNLDFMLAMQIPEGVTMDLPVGPLTSREDLVFTPTDVSGMAHHKAHNEVWTPLPYAPHTDDVPRYLYPPSTAATLNLAASAAIGARAWADVDADYASRALNAAIRAYDAALANPDIYTPGTFDGGGGYGDNDVSDEFYWAAAELYAATGEQRYLDDLRASPHFLGAPGVEGSPTGSIAWPSVGALGTITLATVETGLSEAERETARANLVTAADAYIAVRDSEGYAIPFGPGDYVWGSTSNLLNRAVILSLAHEITGEARYREAVVDAMDYILGRNALDQSYVSGYGARPMRNPHHRFWAHAADPAFPKPPAGILSGGPNNQNMSDPIAQTMRGTCAPQACWADHIDSYAMNEVAINWNAPLFWVAGWLDAE